MRIMAIDYGDARTGVAISDMSGTIVGRTLVIKAHRAEQVALEIARLAAENEIERLVLGYPKNMNATLGPRAEKSEALAVLLKEQTGMEPVLWDERLTTVDAHRILSENGRHGKRRKDTVDAVAASLILEGYLGYLKNTQEG